MSFKLYLSLDDEKENQDNSMSNRTSSYLRNMQVEIMCGERTLRLNPR